MVSLEIQERRRKLIDNLRFNEDVSLRKGTIRGCAVGYGNILVYGNCLGPIKYEAPQSEAFENFTKAYGMSHSFFVAPIVTDNDDFVGTDRERAIFMADQLEKFWKDEGEGQSA